MGFVAFETWLVFRILLAPHDAIANAGYLQAGRLN